MKNLKSLTITYNEIIPFQMSNDNDGHNKLFSELVGLRK